jgi:hypothetical protein
MDKKSVPSVGDEEYYILAFEHVIKRMNHIENKRKYDPIENFKYSFPEIFNEGTPIFLVIINVL